MAVIKVACPDCGQRVSGDESFFGKTVTCPACSAAILFPEEPLDEWEGVGSGESETKYRLYPAEKNEPAPQEEQPPSPEPASPDPGAAETGDAPGNVASKRVAAAAAAAAASAAAPVVSPALKTLTGAPANKPPAVAPAVKRTSTAATWSVVLGAGAFAACPVGPLLAAPAIVCGHLGRRNIHHSKGTLVGSGLATAGLLLGYFFFALMFLALIVLPWKQLWVVGVQKYNENTATTLVQVLGTYAENHEGNYPESLEELVPDYLSTRESQALRWKDPARFLVSAPFNYYPGHRATDEPGSLLIASPPDEKSGLVVVGFLGGEVDSLPEEKLEGGASRE